MSLGELQSQSEKFSEIFDKSMDPFAKFLRDTQPKKYDEIMSGEMTPKMSQSSIYSLNAPKSFYESIKSNYDWQSNARKKNETDANLWKAKHDALLPSVQEYKNYRTEVSPIRRAYPKLHQENTNMRTRLNNINADYNYLARHRNAIREFARLFPGVGEGLAGRILRQAPLERQQQNPYPYYQPNNNFRNRFFR